MVGWVAPGRHVGEGGGTKFWLVERRNRSGTRDFGLVAEAIDGRQLVPLAMHWCADRLDSKTVAQSAAWTSWPSQLKTEVSGDQVGVLMTSLSKKKETNGQE